MRRDMHKTADNTINDHEKTHSTNTKTSTNTDTAVTMTPMTMVKLPHGTIYRN